jgi:hypothetical protein
LAPGRRTIHLLAVTVLTVLVALLPIAEPGVGSARPAVGSPCGAREAVDHAATACGSHSATTSQVASCCHDASAADSHRPCSPSPDAPRSPAPQPGKPLPPRCPIGKTLPCCNACAVGGVVFFPAAAFAQDPGLAVIGTVDPDRVVATSRHLQPPVPPPWTSSVPRA